MARNVVKLLTGTMAAQALALLTLPFLTRAYGPEAFGIFAVYSAIIYVISVGICGRYEMGIVLPRREAHARTMLILSLHATTLVTAALVLASLVLSAVLQPRSEAYRVVLEYALLVPASLLAMGWSQAATGWFTRTKQFGELVHIRFQQVVFALGLQLLLARSGLPSGVGLIIGFVAAQWLTLFYCAWTLRRAGVLAGFLPDTHWGWRRLRATARIHAQLPVYSLPAGMLNSLGQQSLSLVLTLFFVPQVIGQIAIAQRALKMPLNLVTQSVGQVFAQRLARNVAKGVSNVPLVVRWVRGLTLVSLLGAVPVVLWAEPVFEWLFGAGWGEAGRVVVLLLPIALAQFCVRAVSRMFVYRKNHVGLVWQVAFSAGAVLTMVLGGLSGSPDRALIAYAWFGAVMYLLHLALTLRYAGGSLLSLFGSTRGAKP
jgi:O-antigen/teichoic acid export membrane protein